MTALITSFLLRLRAQIGSASELGLPDVPPDQGTFQTILGLVFLVIGAASVVYLILFGAIRYIFSTGNPEETKKAKDTIIYAMVGIVVSLMAFVIVRFVASRF